MDGWLLADDPVRDRAEEPAAAGGTRDNPGSGPAPDGWRTEDWRQAGLLAREVMMLRLLDRLEEILISSLMAGATLIIFVAVLHRYGSGVPILYPILYPIDLGWAQEVCVYMFVWMAKFGAAYGVRTGIHVGVDVLVNAARPAFRRNLVLFGLFCGALFTAVIGTMGAKFVIGLYGTDQVSPDLEIPRWFVFLCVPLGSYLMCFRFLQVAWHFWRTDQLPHHDPGEVEGIDVPPVVRSAL